MLAKPFAACVCVCFVFGVSLTIFSPGGARALETKPAGEELLISKPPFAALTAEEEKRLAMLLERWERGVVSMERYRCKFHRWDFDSTYRPSNSEEAQRFSTGVIQYASPNKLLYRVDEIMHVDISRRYAKLLLREPFFSVERTSNIIPKGGSKVILRPLDLDSPSPSGFCFSLVSTA